MDDHICKGPDIISKFKNDPGKTWCDVPSCGMDTAAILENTGCSGADINELVGKSLTRVKE